MSLPTVYVLKNAAGEELAHSSTQVWSWSHVSRSRQRKEFDTEVGELLATDVLPYCEGKQENAPNPKFSLADIATMESLSADGVVTCAEFPACVRLYVEHCHEVMDLMKKGSATDPEDIAEWQEMTIAAERAQKIFDAQFGGQAAPAPQSPKTGSGAPPPPGL